MVLVGIGLMVISVGITGWVNVGSDVDVTLDVGEYAAWVDNIAALEVITTTVEALTLSGVAVELTSSVSQNNTPQQQRPMMQRNAALIAAIRQLFESELGFDPA